MLKLINSMRGDKGLTLVEVIIAMCIGFVGAMCGYAFLANVYGTRTGGTAVAQSQQEARFIVERMTRELRESSVDVIDLAIWSGTEEGYDTVFFYTPRDPDGRFIVDSSGEPIWQRDIAYALDRYTNELYRFQYYLNSYDPYEWEVVSKNVEELSFSLTRDMLSLSIRTFADSSGKMGHTGRSYSDFYTMVKLRN